MASAKPSQRLDIIANKFLRLPIVHSTIVQATGALHHTIVILFLRMAENIFDNATPFHPRDERLQDHPDPGAETVGLLVVWGKLLPWGLLVRVQRLHTSWDIPW